MIVTAVDGRLRVDAPYQADATPAWRALPGRRWDGSANWVPATQLEDLKGLLATHYASATVEWR